MTRCQIARLLTTSALVVAWAVSPSQWLLAAQDPASPTAAAGAACESGVDQRTRRF